MTPEELRRMVAERTAAIESEVLHSGDVPRCWNFHFYFPPEQDGWEWNEAGFNVTQELLDDLIDPEAFANAAATHIRVELQKPYPEEKRRVFIVDRQCKYHFPANRGEPFDFFRDSDGNPLLPD